MCTYENKATHSEALMPEKSHGLLLAQQDCDW